MAVRLGGWVLDRTPGTYGDALSRLLGSALSDVIVLRQAEMRRREILAEPARPVGTEPEAAPTLKDLACRVEALEAGRRAAAG